MSDPQEIKQIEARLCALMNERLGLSQPSLEKAVRRAGRRLPSSQKKRAQVIIEALAKADHPALFAQLSETNLYRADVRLTEYLETIDRKKLRVDSALRLVASLSFNVLLLAAIVITVLHLRGFI
ncbi:hypothetical protein KO498_08040 [Lentibacter algarum]|uniref:hypothetical protein n=1 Tax=Lentibacter algarum TaxID=576131 RepID=UPI001C07533C|nr:hypothetical protein [Lentibacter algarum]MBU2981764.1 hypothetical protein [Lentibacter algarum]